MQTRLTRKSGAGQKGVHLELPSIKCQELRRLIIGGSGGKICSWVNESNLIGWLESQDAKKITRHFNKNAEDLTYWMGDGKYNICRDGDYSIVNTNELARSLKDNLICKQCSDESMSNIVHNAVDEYSNYLERSLNISIPYHITKQFKSEDGKKKLSTSKSIEFSVKNVGIASSMKIECTNKHCSHVVEPKKSCFFEESTNKRGRKKLSHYEINLKMVLLSLAVGIGPSEAG